MSGSIQYGPWHDVEIAANYYVSQHPADCGWIKTDPFACPFESVLDDCVGEPGVGTFRARVVMDHYEINGTGYTADTLEWEPVGGGS